MEEPIWLVFGIIMVLVSVGIIVQLVAYHNGKAAEDFVFDSLDKLLIQCNMVCSASEDTLLSISIDVPGNARLLSKGQSICAEFDEKRECVRCGCNLNDYVLDISNSSLAKKIVKHKYYCFFEKHRTNVSMECKG
jgi:hypothetical protein